MANRLPERTLQATSVAGQPLAARTARHSAETMRLLRCSPHLLRVPWASPRSHVALMALSGEEGDATHAHTTGANVGVFRHECGEFHGNEGEVLVVGQRLLGRPGRPAVRARLPVALKKPTVGSLEEPSTWHARVVPRFGVANPTEPRRPIPSVSLLHSSA